MAQTKTSQLIDLNLLPIETLAEMANEAAEQCENNARATVQKAIDAGRYLTAIKEQLPHGEWLPWVAENWKYVPRQAERFMQLANSTRASNLEQASSVREALRIVAADPETPKRDRAAAVPSGETQEKYTPSPVEGTNEKAPSAATGKAERADSPPKGNPESPSRPVPEIPPVADEDEPDPIDDWFSCRTLEAVVLKWIGDTPDATAQKSAARHLRKLADQLDPPEDSPMPVKVPTISQLIKAIPETAAALHEEIETWARHKQSLAGKDRVRSMESWMTMINRMVSAEQKHGSEAVKSSILNSVANQYVGWDIELKQSGNGSTRNGTAHRGAAGKARPTGESVFG